MRRASDILIGAIGGAAAAAVAFKLFHRRSTKANGGTYHAGMIHANKDMIEH